jgi:copper chaperone
MIDVAEPTKSRLSFHVTNMCCGRSAGKVVRVVMAVDGDAVVRIDLPMRRIEIEPSRGEARDFRNAINQAGFTPMRQWGCGR